MKNLVLVFSLLSSASAFAAARDTVSVDCAGQRNEWNVTFTAKRVFITDDKKTVSLRDVKMTVKSDRGEPQVGRIATIENDPNYRPTRYKNHLKIDINQLTDVSDFSKYYPDGCSVNLMIPNKLVSSNSSNADFPLQASCEQSGQSMTLKCKVETVR